MQYKEGTSMFSFKRDSEEKRFAGVYKKITPVCFYDIRLGQIEKEYQTNGWGPYIYRGVIRLGERISVPSSEDFGKIRANVYKELERLIIG